MARAMVGLALGGGWTQTPGVTAYAPLSSSAATPAYTTETGVDANTQIAASINRFSCEISTNTLSTATTTFRVRKNGANGMGLISVAAGVTGDFSDQANVDSLAVGDRFNVSVAVDAGGANSIIVRGIKGAFFANTGHAVIKGSGALSQTSMAIIGASTTRWFPINGLQDSPAGTNGENNSECRLDAAGTLRDFQMYIANNARTTTTTFRIRKNNANGNQILSILAGTTGWFQDTSNTDAVAAGDDFAIQYTTGTGTEIITEIGAAVMFTNSTADTNDTSAQTANGVLRNPSGTPTFYPFIGITTNGQASEANATLRHDFNVVTSRMRIYISQNLSTDAVTMTIRKNSADGNQTLSITASTTGLFQDVTNTDSFDSDDTMCYQLVGGATSTIRLTQFGILEDPDPVGDTSQAMIIS